MTRFTIIEAYHEADRLVSKEEATWSKINLADLIFADIMFGILNERLPKRYSVISSIKLWLSSFRRPLAINRHSNKERAVLFFVNSKSHCKNAIPVINELVRQNVNPVVVTTKLDLVKSFERMDILVSLIQGYDILARPSISIKSIQIKKLLKFYFPKISYLHRSFKKQLKLLSPGYVFIGNDNTLEGRLLARLCEQAEIKTGCIQHGHMNRINPLHGRSIVDQYFTYGSKTRDELIYLKSTSELKVVGNPQIFNNINRIGFEEFERAPFVLVAFSGIGHGTTNEQFEIVIDWLFRAQMKIGLKICIKLHPKDKAENYVNLFSKNTIVLSDNDLINRNLNFYDLIVSSQFLITGASSSTLEALAMGKDVITIDPLNEYEQIDFIKDGLTYHVRNESQLHDYIETLIAAGDAKSGIKKGIENYFYKCLDNNYSPAKEIVSSVLKFVEETDQKLSISV